MGASELITRARGLLLRLLANREAKTVLAFSAANTLGGLAANRVLTQLVPPQALGELYLFLNLALWLTLPSGAAFLYVHRHWPIARARGAVHRFAHGLAVGLSVQGALVALGTAVAIALGLPLSPLGALGLVLAGGAQAALQTLVQLQALERRRALVGVLELLGQPARLLALGLGSMLVWGNAPTGEGLLLIHGLWTTVLAAAVVWLTIRLVRDVAPNADSEGPAGELTLVVALRFSAPFLVTAGVAQACTSAERWGLASLADPSATALFVQAVGLSAAAAGSATSFLSSYFYPLILHGASHSSHPLQGARVPLRRFLLLVVVVSALLVIGALIGAGQIAALLFGPRYAGVVRLLPWTIAGAALFVVAQAVSVISLVLRDAVGPNLARTLPLVLYAIALISLRPAGDAALAFSRLYCGAQGLYLLLMLGAVLVGVRQSARQVTEAQAASETTRTHEKA